MFNNFDDVVDDFLFKRMGAGEQWYGKRKYNPSGKFDGDYNGMGRSDFYRIEIAKIQKEEMEKKRQRRLEREQQQKWTDPKQNFVREFWSLNEPCNVTISS